MTASRPQPQNEESSRRSRKRREAAFILPFCGLVVFASPVLDMFTGTTTSLGGKIAYIFGSWITLILIGLVLSRLLRSDIRDK